jgi:transposase InsO family protein
LEAVSLMLGGHPHGPGTALRHKRDSPNETLIRRSYACLHRLLILNQPHLERILDVFVDHYNGHRPHRALSLTPPEARRPSVASTPASGDARIVRRDRLGGVVHEYVLAA